MKNFRLITSIVILFFAFACDKQFIENEKIALNPTKPESSAQFSGLREEASQINDQFMVLGRKLKNPYTIENMKKALENINANRPDKLQLNIKPNYLYVRFLPKNEEEYALLNRDKNLELYNYPLDYEIVKRGNSYRDSSIKDGSFSWKYAAVKVEYDFPKIQHEILSELYLPDKDDELKNKYSNLIDVLDNEALRLSDNLPEKKLKNTKVASWIPNGQIQMFDDVKNMNVPIKGCKVRTRRWFSTESTLTDNWGYYNIGVSYNNPANHEILWSRADFDILNSDLDIAVFNGPEQSTPWSLVIISGKSRLYAVTHRAAYEYYYNNFTLTTPGYTRLSVRDENEQNYRPGLSNQFNPGGFKIKIWTKIDDANNNNLGYRYRSCLETFGTVIHELGHNVHYLINTTGYNFGSSAVAESWGEGVKWHFTSIEYGKCGDAVFVGSSPSSPLAYSDPTNFTDNFQRRFDAPYYISQSLSPIDYTPIVIDLIDNFNQETSFGAMYANDNVSGYSIVEFQQAIRYNDTWGTVRDYLTSHSSNPQTAAVNILFSQW
ncbi:hypothetical protein [Emticicia soli]|uniref:Uncharacterized protein n=1 Tax=Emticicia soli TaxID=2027878 RepID=A0ABW5J4U3_9BACT